MRIRQSDLNAAQRCFQQKHLIDQQVQETGIRGQTNSMTVFGTVVHFAVQILEQLHHEQRPDALDVALSTFDYYWHPDNVRQLQPQGIDVWLPRSNWGALHKRGRKAITDYYPMLKADQGLLLALEYTWNAPITIDGQRHELTGTVDRLAIRHASDGPYLSVEDFKTGKKPTYTRQLVQWTMYSYASTQPAFWEGFGELIEPVVKKLHTQNRALFNDGTGLSVIKRRGRWINMGQGSTVSIHDVGWRDEGDYARLKVQLREYVNAHTHQVFPLNLTGEVCLYCPFSRNGACGGVPISET